MAAPSKDELELLSNFRSRLTDLNLTQDQSSDMFLLRWIRARENKLDRSEAMLRKSLKWRAEGGVDSVLTWEPPPIVLELLPLDATIYDKDNRPVVILPFGPWNLKKAAADGNQEQCVRYICQVWETLLKQINGKRTAEGVPMTQFNIIVDMGGLSLKTVGSFAVLEVFKGIAGQFESNYPEVLNRCFIINAARAFQILWAVIKPIVSQRTSSKIQILTSPSEWKPLLLELIDADQLPELFGGSKDSTLHKFYNYSMKNKDDDSYEEVTVAAGKILKVPVEVSNCKSSLKWDFTIENYDIEFFVTLEEKMIVPKQKVDSQNSPVVGSFKCKDPGTYVLNFDNSYSRMRSKALKYSVKVVDKAGNVKL